MLWFVRHPCNYKILTQCALLRNVCPEIACWANGKWRTAETKVMNCRSPIGYGVHIAALAIAAMALGRDPPSN
jgi:hypothetical protein